MTTTVMEPAVETAPAAPPSVVDDLKRARAVLVEYGWCQDAYAVTADGAYVYPDSALATGYCTAGSVLRVLGEKTGMTTNPRWLRAASALNGVLKRDKPWVGSIAAFNDAPGRTKNEVIALFDRAIALAEAEEVGR